MASFTLIELHLDGDTQFGPKRIGEATLGEGNAEGEAEEGAAAEEEGGGKPIGVLIGLVLLVALGLAVRKRRSGDDIEEFEEPDEPDVVVD